MAPSPQETMVSEKTVPAPLRRPGNEVVISGMSGVFPKSGNVQEFMENLYNKVDMVTIGNRWIYDHPEVPKHLGMVDGMEKFDAQFFKVHYKQACTMEPMSRKLLEHAYSAIYDSGTNPLQLRGKKVGVFIGSTFSESEKIVIYENVQQNGFGITGSNKAMYANRISYWMDAKGPSYAIDLSCASSMACLEHAYRSISSGQCEAAIVGGCNLCMHPNVSLHCRRAGFLSLDGKTRCFDKNSDGHVRSDAVNVLFLQKAKDAKRIYSEVYHAKIGFSPKSEELIAVREPKELEQFFEAFYSEIGISPDAVEYVEANGAAILQADTNELQAIGKVFAKNTPIKIGCFKSNMGSSEPASGVCGVTKVCLAYQNGKLPGNLNYNDPLDLPDVRDNKIQVLTENSDFGRGFAALNSFSYGGANVHVLLKGHYKQKEVGRYKSSIPYLVLISGRNDDAVKTTLENMKKNAIDPEQIGLFHSIHELEIPAHMSRGYTILGNNENNETISLAQSVDYCPGNPRPVWFVYSGMGSQWATMGAELMKIPIFAAAIQKCHKVLEPKGIDIVHILTTPDKNIYDNILHSFVGIAAVQIGLTDILTEMGIVPDNIIGHSVGELGCAYADGCFTAEEMILSAYSRGLVSVQTPFIRGSMAAVGLGYSEVLPLCPPEIEVACHNSSDSSTISGPADIMKQFVTELTSQGVFAKEVPCSNIAYHSRYIAEAGPGLFKYLSDVIKNPKTRSKKWISTSIPEDKWEEPLAKYSSAEYHTNNLLNPVLFEETSKQIPSDAYVIEIAPHGLLQAILKRSMPDCAHVPLTRRGTADPVKFFLEAIGKLYVAGLNPKINVLYPKIEYPVSTGTPFLSHFVGWEHSEDWPQAKLNKKDRVVATIRDFAMSVYDDDFKYFKGHMRDGNYVFPESAFLVLVWETFAMYKNTSYKDMSVVFQNIRFHGEAIIKPEFPVRLQIKIFKGNNQFEVEYEDYTIVSGSILESNTLPEGTRNLQEEQEESSTNNVLLSAKDIYTIMRLRGYGYKDEFQSIHSCTSDRNKASIKWTDNWITELDSVLQFNAFAREFEGVSSPSMILQLKIDVRVHKNADKIVVDKATCIIADIYSEYKYSRCGGIELDGIVFKDKPIVEQKPDVLLSKNFVPNFLTGVVETKTALQVNLQIVSENVTKNDIQVIDLTSRTFPDLSKTIKDVATEIATNEFIIKDAIGLGAADLLVIDNLFGDEKKMDVIHKIMPNKGFILALEKDTTIIHPQHTLFYVITAMTIQNHILILLRNIDSNEDKDITYIPIVFDRKFSWVSRLQNELERSRKIVLVSEREHYCGLLGMVQKLRKKFGSKIELIVVDDFHVPSFNPQQKIFKDQIEKKLAINVLHKGKWGGFYNVSGEMTKQLDNVHLSSTKAGDLESLSWVERPPLLAKNNLVQVCYAGPSTKDVKVATGDIDSTKHHYGIDFSGINERGERVMGLLSGGSIASTVQADPDFLWPIPEHWTLEDAATVPLAYTYAFYCLTIKCQLKKGATVLVNGGAGALGQAIINVSLALGCSVHVTVEDVKQKEFLLTMFPNLKAQNVGRNPQIVFSMREEARDMKNNYTLYAYNKCGVVINCLSGPLRKSAMDCVGLAAYFLDLNDYDMKNNEEFGLGFFYNSSNYLAVNIDGLFRKEYANEKKLIQLRVSEGIANGIVKPLSRVVYPPVSVTRAFRLLSSSKDRSKVLIRMKSSNTADYVKNVTAKMAYCSKGSYVVICNGSALGVELTDRLVKHGARNLLIHIKPNTIAGYCYTKIISWKNVGVSLNISSENLQTEKGCANLLKEGAKLGSIRGIFIVHNYSSGVESWTPEDVTAKFNNTAAVVANLDLMSRNTCNELDHFVIVNYSSKNISDEYVSSVTDKICRSRNDIGLPALAFHAGELTELSDIESDQTIIQPQPLSAMFNALETSLKLKHNNVITYNLKKNLTSEFVQKISRIICVKNIQDLDENLTLADLLLNEISIDEISIAIKSAYQISYSAEKLQRMTIGILKNLGQKQLSKASSNKGGLGTFFTYIDKDECKAAEPIVTMETSYNGVMEEDELDPEATYLIMVPGFEGHHQIFTKISERLKVQALTVQLVADMENESVSQIAANVAKSMMKRLEVKTKFYLLGYSFGVNVALELARIFEKEGHLGVVYCLDSSPDALRAQLDAYIGNLTDSELQNTIILHMYKLMSGRESAELKQELQFKDNWNEKVELCVNKLLGLVKFSHQYTRGLLNSAYKRIILAREYQPKFTLESELVLIKGILHPDMCRLPEDFNLSQYTTKPVKVFDIELDHASAHQDCRVSNIVNKFLEPKLLEEFKNRNLCWSYLANPVKAW